MQMYFQVTDEDHTGQREISGGLSLYSLGSSNTCILTLNTTINNSQCSQNVHSSQTHINIRTLEIFLYVYTFFSLWPVLFWSADPELGLSFIEIHHPWIYLKF